MTTTFWKGERVILRDRFLNPAEVLEEVASTSLDDEVRVRLLYPPGSGSGSASSSSSTSPSSSSMLAVRRRNLLRASVQSDRRVACQLHAIATHPGLRIASPRLAERLGGCEGLVLAIAGFATGPRTFPFQFTGYMGGLVDEYCFFDEQATPRPFSRCSVGPARIDCGSAVVGIGQVAFCGGCGAHPNAAAQAAAAADAEEEEEEGDLDDDDDEGNDESGKKEEVGFFRSAVLYDSLLDEWQRLPRMRLRRHGASAVCVGRRSTCSAGTTWTTAARA